ncbi:PilZ domain-containing protein [Aureimonas sp. ME7]|uniref:PilZ domain-containing protein n=1 Tax=Aureimonas sp. ME7 TaxID=2744252 RepID=UPI0015F4A200|nr:PilZ domain-containing protein [Aureimonas sp. ME7]
MSALPHPSIDDNERRVAPRTRTLRSAKILFNNRYSTFDCVLRNISSTGALLTIDPSVPLPKVFEIRIGDDPIRPAKLVYRREAFAGIHFLDVAEEGEGEMDFSGHEREAASADEGLRIHPRPLPQALVQRLPWFHS